MISAQGRFDFFSKQHEKLLRVHIPKSKRKVRFKIYDFKRVQASEGVCGVHKFPAMLHFRLVEEFIKEFSKEGDTIYDPFLWELFALIDL